MASSHLLLLDCSIDELHALKQDLEKEFGCEFDVNEYHCYHLHGSKAKNLRRFMRYFWFPLKIFIGRGDVKVIIGWQQFFAINYAFYSRLFRCRRDVRIIACNYTYKEKKGVAGRVFGWYMKYAAGHPNLLGLHVPSYNTAGLTSGNLGVSPDKMIVAHFGTVDERDRWAGLGCEYEDFALAIGRSNRDFDFLARVWMRPEIQATNMKLLIISDTWVPGIDISESGNIIHRTDINEEASHGYIANCRFSVVPIDRPDICSGDTVLLNSMMMSKPVVVTTPGTLSEMYVEDGVNGLLMPARDEAGAARVVLKLIEDPELRTRLGDRAREIYLERFTRDVLAGKLAAESARRCVKSLSHKKC